MRPYRILMINAPDGMGLTPLGYFGAGVLGSAVGLGNAVEACNIGK